MDMFFDPLFPLAQDDMGTAEMDRMTDIGMLPDNSGRAAIPNGMANPNGMMQDSNNPMRNADDMRMEDNGVSMNGRIASDSIDPALLSLAMAFVPRQSWEEPYAPDVALSRGTIFPGLDKPLLGEPPLSPQPRMERGAGR